MGSYASFGARLGARLLDSLILTIPTIVLVILMIAVVPTEDGFCDVNGRVEPCTVPTAAGVMLIVLVGLAALIASAAYYILPTGRRGATLGQRALRIEVVDLHSGSPIGVGRATGRFFMSWVSGWPCYLGYLWMLWDQRKQTWHDKVVNSVVIKR